MTAQPLAPGRSGEASVEVTADRTATALGSGDVEVFGTPALLALIEEAACRALDDTLPEGRTHVGVRVELDHLAPSRIGARVRAVATLTAVDGPRLDFLCEAYDGDTLVGRATHRRVVVPRDRFS